jgi:glycerol kinase
MIGVAHQIVDAVDAVAAGLAGPVGTLRVDGGLGRNDSVLQAIADLSGLCLERTASAEVTAFGAASLAGLGTGQWDQVALAGLSIRTDRTVRPSLPAEHRAAARKAWRELVAEVTVP